MIDINNNILTMLNAPSRQICGRAELYNGAALLHVFNSTDHLKSFTVERQSAQGKFFGFGVTHKLSVSLVDRERAIEVIKGHTMEVELGAGTAYVYFCPYFTVAEVKRDENTNELSITAFDALHKAAEHYVNELDLPEEGYTIKTFLIACARLLGLPYSMVNVSGDVFNTYYEGGANFEGTETIRTAFDMIAEATQTIYYIGNNWELTFKRLDMGAAVYTIDKAKYFTLSSKTTHTLAEVTHCTELGDNVTATTGESGAKQYVRDNAFWEMREDVADIVTNAIEAVGGLSINQFECEWRGNFALEIGDRIELITKDNNSVFSYILSDTITYTGALSQKSTWSYSESTGETATNPATVGEALKQTFARVDKVNKKIDLVVAESADNAENISALQMQTDSITASVNSLNSKVSTQITDDQVNIKIQNALENDVKRVETETGYKFDKDGLTVSKAGLEMSTQITEDGMQVFKGDDVVLTANNVGVNAQNLHATTYIIIGENSRLETYQGNRTACFWIGG